MKALILSCSTGGGHNAAALALKAHLESIHVDTTLLDILKFASDDTSSTISKLYSHTTVKTPALFGFLYKAGGLISTPKFKSIIYGANTLYTKKLATYLATEKIDTVICTHLFSAQAITYITRHTNLPIKTYAVATDYTCIPFWEDCEMDAFFIPHQELLSEFQEHGVKASTLVPIGIPVHSDFLKPLSKELAKATLDLDPHKPLISIMCGSMGFGHIKPLVRHLTKQLKNVNFFIVCGHNDQLYYELMNLGENIYVQKFIDYSPLLMKASDILLTKPGGLTSTEAVISLTPLVHLAPIPGCETCNKAFFTKHHLSLDGDTPNKALIACKRLLEDSTFLNQMLIAQACTLNHKATSDICDYILMHS
ncbi:MAG: galactosyldiacylglycerol synthase [Candidatus Niameybacter stercoravium]|nr:galactosyldiacylglycerol synthase [Candidatus Niameybacter stercoravium]